MGKIVGNPTVTPVMPSDWAQKDETKVDYIKNKPTKLSQFENDEGYLPREEVELYVGAELDVLYGELDKHALNKENPHKVTAEQVGTYPKGEIDIFVSDLGDVSARVAELENGKVDKELGKGLSSNDFTDEWKGDINSAIEIAISAQGDVEIHEGRQDNPHNVTAEQVGVYTKGQVDNFRIQDEMNMERHVGLRIDESLGDISTALDELHTYAQALIGGAEQ